MDIPTPNDFNAWSAALGAVQNFEHDEDYQKFDMLVNTVTGKEDERVLRRLIDAVCVEYDNGPYEGLHNAIWRFPGPMVSRVLGEVLPAFQRRMGFAPFQVWRFYLPLGETPENIQAFIAAAQSWNTEDAELGLATLQQWCTDRYKDEVQWTPVVVALGGRPLPRTPTDPPPEDWPQVYKDKLAAWRALPPDDTSLKVFWAGSKAENEATWKSDLPLLVQALALRHGPKWRDVKVWLNPLSFFARSLWPHFIEAMANADPQIRNRALANITRTNAPYAQNIQRELQELGIKTDASFERND